MNELPVILLAINVTPAAFTSTLSFLSLAPYIATPAAFTKLPVILLAINVNPSAFTSNLSFLSLAPYIATPLALTKLPVCPPLINVRPDELSEAVAVPPIIAVPPLFIILAVSLFATIVSPSPLTSAKSAVLFAPPNNLALAPKLAMV